MGLGAIIASGEENELLSNELFDCITEVRVEQTLDQPIRFAIRFQEDLQDGEPRVRQTPELQAEQIIAIAVETRDEIKCLVRGPITETKGSTTLGGPGSWYEVRGQDRRIEMSRVCARRAWIGRASEVAEAILSSHAFTPETQETTRVYEESTGTLNQRGSDLDFIRQLARTNNLSFWISYESQSGGLNPLGPSSLTIEEIANFTSSPPRPEGGLDVPLPPIPSSRRPTSPFESMSNRVAARRFRASTSTSTRNARPNSAGARLTIGPCGPRPLRRRTRSRRFFRVEIRCPASHPPNGSRASRWPGTRRNCRPVPRRL